MLAVAGIVVRLDWTFRCSPGRSWNTDCSPSSATRYRDRAAGAVRLLALVVATVALGLMMRVTLAPWQGFEAPFRRPNHPWCVSVVAGWSVYMFVPVPMWVLVGLSVVFGVAAMIADRREIHACRLRATARRQTSRNDPPVTR